MTNTCEPWDNSYILDGETERLLRKLIVSPLTDEQVVRSCLKQVHSLLSPDDKAKLKTKMGGGIAGLLGFDLQPFSEAVGEWMQKSEQTQQEVDWGEVGEEDRELSKKRAGYILKYATDNGWVARVGEKGEWEITERGRAKIEEGGFNMR
jgi:hypothetical protein